MKRSSESKSVERTLVVATLNVNGLPPLKQDAHTRSLLAPYSKRFPELGKQIEASNVDVINLQEVFTHRERRLLVEHLPSFVHSTFEPAVMGPKGGLVTFSKRPIEKVSYESFFRATRPADRSELPFLCLAKSAMKGILISRLLDEGLVIANAHPLANYDWDWSPDNRFHSLEEAQLAKVASVVRRITAEGGNLVLGADLNVSKDSELFKSFMGKVGLRDTFEGDIEPTFQPEFVGNGQLPTCIDYLMVGGDIAINQDKSHRIFEEKVAVDGLGEIYLTDHYGLTAELTL